MHLSNVAPKIFGRGNLADQYNSGFMRGNMDTLDNIPSKIMTTHVPGGMGAVMHKQTKRTRAIDGLPGVFLTEIRHHPQHNFGGLGQDSILTTLLSTVGTVSADITASNIASDQTTIAADQAAAAAAAAKTSAAAKPLSTTTLLMIAAGLGGVLLIMRMRKR